MSQQLPTPVSALLDAVNNGDTDAFVGAFTTAGTVDDWGRIFTGAEDIRGWSDNEFIGKNVRLSIYSIDAVDNHVLVVAEVRSTGFNGPSTFTFSIDDDAVSAMKIRA